MLSLYVFDSKGIGFEFSKGRNSQLTISQKQAQWDEVLYSVFLAQGLDERRAQSTWNNVCENITAEKSLRQGPGTQCEQSSSSRYKGGRR
jgi:hypothetical protein